MRQTRRRNEYTRAQGAQRTALPFTRIDAPVGGWNTRDSEDNLPPTDALELDNWWPDIGEVRTRPGYSEHCFTGDATTGSDLVLNGGFETAGGGGPDVFASWSEAPIAGKPIEQSTALVQSGTYSCRFYADSLANIENSAVQQNIAVTAEKFYRLQFYDTTTAGEYYTGSIRYIVYDNTNASPIVSSTNTGHTGDSLSLNRVVFQAPAGCVSIKINFLSAELDLTNSSYLDSVSLFEITENPGSIETLAEYISGANRQLIAIDGEEAFNVSSSTPVHLSGSIAAFTNARFQWVNFDGKMGLVNGAEELVWDGTNLTTYAAYAPGTIELSGGIGHPIGINVFKSRVWYWEAASQDVWYTALNALGGACTKFPLSRVGQFGGNLVLMETWTRDGGSGPDDFAVFVMSSGEAIVYQGSYPGAAGDWALVGIYNIGEPIGYRSAVKFGGDLYIITKLDVVRMSEVIQGIEARQMESKIVPSHRTMVNLYQQNWGWEASIYPKGHMAIFNIPVNVNAEMLQHVQNTITGAWCRFSGIVANTWQMFDGSMYIGSNDGYVYKFDDGEYDNVDPIESTLQTAWMPIGGTGGNKLFKAVRESYKCNTDITVNNVFATDFRAFAAQNFPVAIDDAGSYWSILPSTDPVSVWDLAAWSAFDTIFNEWEIIGAFGERISMRKKLSTKQRVTLLGSDWLVEPGDRL